MQTFKKVVISIISFILIIVIMSALIIVPPIKNKSMFYHDADFRKDLAGKVDFLAVGASHCLSGVKPEILDEKLGVCSYNLSGTWLPMHGRYYILKKELERNNVDTVVLEISFDALTLSENHEHSVGDTALVQRLDSFGECFSYLKDYVPVNELMNVYSRLLSYGATYYEEVLLGDELETPYKKDKGYRAKEIDDITLTKEEASESLDSLDTPVDYDEESIKWLDKTIALCKEKNVKLIMAVVPVSDMEVWQQNNLDYFSNWITEYCKEKDCILYDFNLLTNRSDLFSDKVSFHDHIHMSDEGASTFTAFFADFLKKADSGEDLSYMFYSNYKELKQHMPYSEICK